MNDDRDLGTRLERWLETREAPAITTRLSEEILATVARTPQERPLLPRLRLPAPRDNTFRLLALAAALMLAVGGLTSVLVGGSRPVAVAPPTASPAASPAPSPLPTPTAIRYPEVVSRIPLDGESWQVVAMPTRVWVQIGDVGLVAIDSVTGELAAEVEGGSWMIPDGDDLWVQLPEAQALVRLDPVTGAERERFENVPGYFVAKDGNTAWSAIGDRGVVVRTDLETGREVASIEVPAMPKQIAVAEGSVWVICDDGNALARIDPERNEVIDTIDVGTGPVEIEYGLGSIWIRNRDRELVRVDPATGEVVATIEGFGFSPSLGLSIGGGYAWASTFTPLGIGTVDPATNEIVHSIPLPGPIVMDSSWLDGTLWVTTASGRQLLQVDASTP